MMSQEPLAKVVEAISKLTSRIRALEANGRAEVSGGVEPVLFASLPVAGQPGRQYFVTNGRKSGEGAGAGTGVLAVDDGTNWVHVGTDTVVVA